MKRAGRMSPLVVLGILCILLLLPLFLVAQKGPENVAADFMTALGKGDVNTLADLSVIGNDDVNTRRQKWQQTIDRSKHFLFTWRVTDAIKNDPNDAVVELQVRRNLQIRMGLDETKFELPMVRVNGQWKVDVPSVDRDLFPALPRA